MDAEGVQRVVIAELWLQERDRIVADQRGNCAEHDGAKGAAVAGCGGDRNQTGDHAGAEAQGRSLVTAELFSQHPEQGTRSGRHKGVDHRKTSGAICFQL